MNNIAPPTREQLAWMYHAMALGRAYEDMIKAAYLEDKLPAFHMTAGPIPGEMHLASGQEPCAAGVCVHLQARDWIVAPHRPHHIAVAKGIDLNQMTAEIFGRQTGLGGGRGGHMHISAPQARFTSTSIVGQAIGIAAGHALAAQMDGTGAVAVGYIGEGGANQGLFHETMNLAALWKLPLICVIEDNRWGVSVAKARSTAIARNSDRASAYGCAGEYVEDNDVFAVYAAAGRAVARARNSEGPTILEIETARLEGHFVGDTEAYVPEDERSARQDPIEVMAGRLLSEFGFERAELDQSVAAARDAVAAAEQFARQSPEAQPEAAHDHVFVAA